MTFTLPSLSMRDQNVSQKCRTGDATTLQVIQIDSTTISELINKIKRGKMFPRFYFTET